MFLIQFLLLLIHSLNESVPILPVRWWPSVVAQTGAFLGSVIAMYRVTPGNLT